MDAIVQPTLRKWISDHKEVKKDFDKLMEEVTKLDKTVLLGEMDLRIAEKTAVAKTLKQLSELVEAEEKDLQKTLAIKSSEMGQIAISSMADDSGLESQSQASQEPVPGTSRDAIEKQRKETQAKESQGSSAKKSCSSAVNFMNSKEIARVVCEFAAGDTFFNVKTKKPQGTGKRGRKKKASAVEDGGVDELGENEKPEDWGEGVDDITDEDDNSSCVSDEGSQTKEKEIDLFRSDKFYDREAIEDLDAIHDPTLAADDYVFQLGVDEDEMIYEDSSDDEGLRFNPALMMNSISASPPPAVEEVEVVSTEDPEVLRGNQHQEEFFNESHEPMEVDSSSGPSTAIPGPSRGTMLTNNANMSEGQQRTQDSNQSQPVPDPLQAPATETTRPHSPTRFKRFMNRAFDSKRAELKSQRPEMIAELRKDLGITDDEKLNEIARIINPLRPTIRGNGFREKPVVHGASMPPLVPPFSKEALAKMQSLDVFMTHSEDPSGFQWRSNNVQQQINYDMLNIAFKNRMTLQQKDYETMDHSLLVDKANDVLIEMSVFKPNDPDDTLPDDVKIYQEPKLAYKVEVLGRHTIKNFMEGVVCTLDLISTQEVEHPDKYVEEKEEHMLKNQRLAKIMVIEDTIYAKSDCDIDFIGRINEWTNSKIRKPIGPFKSGDVETKFEDLKLRFGYPYLYVHLNNCEHIVVFNKARMIEPTDEHRLELYPRITKSTFMKNIYCRVDNDHTARWAVVNYVEFPENPMFICTKCLKEFCYTAKGAKRGTFLLYPFRQLSNLL